MTSDNIRVFFRKKNSNISVVKIVKKYIYTPSGLIDQFLSIFFCKRCYSRFSYKIYCSESPAPWRVPHTVQNLASEAARDEWVILDLIFHLKKIGMFMENWKIKLKSHTTVSLKGKCQLIRKNIGRGRFWHRKSFGKVPQRSPSLVDETDCPPHFVVRIFELLGLPSHPPVRI